jgi:predicted NUDIX family phosphoesterase
VANELECNGFDRFKKEASFVSVQMVYFAVGLQPGLWYTRPQMKGLFMKNDEKILVVPRLVLLANDDLNGFVSMTNFDLYEDIIRQSGQFLWRSEMEENPAYKQIIPYLIFKHQERYFLMHRRGDATEQRLKGKGTLGIGGHLREEDMQHGSIITWAQREFHEEVSYAGKLNIEPLGLINDDSNPVGRVHVGFVYLLEGDSPAISIKSELKDGSLKTLAELAEVAHGMETWSQLVLQALMQKSHTQGVMHEASV